MKIQLTGSSGFAGTNLSFYISQDNSFQISPLTIRFEDPNPIIIHSNAVVHLAGKAHDLKKVSQPEEYYQVNFELTKRLYDAFLNSGAEKFILY